MTSLLSKSIRVLRLAVAVSLLPMLASSCQWMSEEYDDEIADSSAAQYINVTVSVSASNSPVTRANPTGGEYGDGPEKGDDRENEVKNITLIFYQDNAGINTTSDDTKVCCVKKYEVYPMDNTGTHTHKEGESAELREMEVLYTTGDQALLETSLKEGETYKVIVVANADPEVNVGDKIKDAREKVISTLYQGTGVGINATDFVMASESDATITLTDPTLYESNTILEKNRYVYHFSCIHIERLAARIDFSTHYPKSNATYDATTYSKPGYVYKIWKEGDTTEPTSNDRFVVTNITPFNLTNGANEFFVKRVSEGNNFASRTDVIPTYLGDETTTNWVLDSYSNAAKTAPSYATYFLANNTLDALKTQTAVAASAKKVELSTTWHNNTDNYISKGGYDNIIVGYATENTIDDNSPLYYYATGLAIEGLYIHDNVAAPRVVYTFLRHQGEGYASGQSSYDAFKLVGETSEETDALILAAKDMQCNPGTAMNFGVVRNNIYRVSIDKITEEPNGPKVTLLIKVKKWDKFVHVPIYM